MGLDSYYRFLIKELEAATKDSAAQLEQAKLQSKARLKEAQLSSSPKIKSKTGKDEDCLKCRFPNLSSSVLSKLLQHAISPEGLNDSSALSKLTKMNVPIEDMAVAISQSGKDLSGIRATLFKAGMKNGSIFKALSQGFDNLSMSSVYNYIDDAQNTKDFNSPKEKLSLTV